MCSDKIISKNLRERTIISLFKYMLYAYMYVCTYYALCLQGREEE